MNNLLIKEIENIFLKLDPEVIQEGIKWYPDANKKIREVAHSLELPVKLVAEVVSILSPAQLWENNVAEAHKLLFSLKYEPEQIDKLTFTTYRSNVEKAIRVYNKEQVLTDEKSGFKTYSFAKNLLLDSSRVTIDRHMLKIADIEKLLNVKSLTKRAYSDFEEGILKVAKKYSLKGYELQAALWIHAREL